MRTIARLILVAADCVFLIAGVSVLPVAGAQPAARSHVAPPAAAAPASESYKQVQQRLARGWNTWDVHSVTTQVLLPEGLAIHVGMKHNSTLSSDAWLGDVLIGRQGKGDEVVTPGPHAWDGSYTRVDVAWRGHSWRVESAHDGDDLVMLVTPQKNEGGALPPTVVFSVGTEWNRNYRVTAGGGWIFGGSGLRDGIEVGCSCAKHTEQTPLGIPMETPYFDAELTAPVGLSAIHLDPKLGYRARAQRDLSEIQAIVARQRDAYEARVKNAGENGPILDAIETTLGWDTIYEPERGRVISPVSRIWSVGWGGYVLFDWDTFFAATLASIGSKDLAYANAVEILRESTPAGFVPNFARAGGWKSFDRSEPPVGAITVLGLYNKFHDRWFLEETWAPLLNWNRWWDRHRNLQGFITLGSDPDTNPRNYDDASVGAWQGAVYESGLDNSPMYDGTTYSSQTHQLEYADVGMTSLYIADCDALAQIAATLGKSAEAQELTARAARYRASLATLWDEPAGIFLNKDLHTGQPVRRLSPTNFYPLLARAATAEQARAMIQKHLLNPAEFDGPWVIPSIARNDPAFNDQNYWRGRIWGPMNYLVYLGLLNYPDPDVRRQFARKSYGLFLKEWNENGHVHENYNAITGSGDDVWLSDRFYHWGALLGYVEYLERSR